MATPAWCSSISDPGTPTEGAEGTNTPFTSATYYASLAGDLTGVTSVEWFGYWIGSTPKPSVTGGSFSFPNSVEVGLYSGVPVGRMDLYCAINGVIHEMMLTIEFTAETVAGWYEPPGLSLGVHFHEDFNGTTGVTLNGVTIDLTEGGDPLVWIRDASLTTVLYDGSGNAAFTRIS